MKKTLAIVLAATLTTCAMGMTSFAEEAPAVMSYEEYIAAELDTEVVDQICDVCRTFPQRRDRDWNNVQPVVQILTELPLGDLLLEVAVGRGDESDIE